MWRSTWRTSDKAARLLEQLAEAAVPQERARLCGFPVTLDAYRLPDYKDHAVYVFSYQLYAVEGAAARGAGRRPVGRGHAAARAARGDRRGGRAGATQQPPEGHLLLRLNGAVAGEDVRRPRLVLVGAIAAGLQPQHDLDLQPGEALRRADRASRASWRKRSTACGTSVPTAATITYDADRDQVLCSVHGNRRHSRQRPELGGRSSFAQLLAKIDRVNARYCDSKTKRSWPPSKSSVGNDQRGCQTERQRRSTPNPRVDAKRRNECELCPAVMRHTEVNDSRFAAGTKTPRDRRRLARSGILSS